MTEPNQGGALEGCQRCSSECHYRCCDQVGPEDPDFSLENGILLYPGEWEQAQEGMRRHLLITVKDHCGGKVAKCDAANFDQSTCHPDRNLKPLDCQSYPFSPILTETGEIDLALDTTRCPLARDPIQLRAHYEAILRRWREVAERNVSIRDWIASLHLKGYVPYRSHPFF